MNENLENMTNRELKAYIKANRNDENACHQAIKLLVNRRNTNNPQYRYDLPAKDMEAIFKAKLQSTQY